MATEFDNSLHWGLFLTGTTLTSETGKYVRVSELVLSALRAAGVFSNMVDGIVAPATDKLWLDKNFDPAVLKEWDATGASWVPMTYGRLFGRAAVDKLTVTGGTGNAVVVSQPVGFQASRLYLMTPTAGNSGAATINVSGVGNYAVKYGDGADLSATEFTAGRQTVLFFTGSRFEVVFPLSGLSAAVLAAQAAANAADASAGAASASASAAAGSAGAASTSATNAANSAAAAANSVAALPYNFSTTTTDADPGTGIFRLNNAAPGSATAAYIDNVDSDGVTATGVLDTWDDSTTAVRGVLTIRSKTNATIRHTYNVTGSVVDGTGYRKLTLAYVGGSGALTNGAAHWLIFDRNGDAGEVTLAGVQTLSNKTLVDPAITGSVTASSSSQFAPQFIARNTYNGLGNGYMLFGKNRAGAAIQVGDTIGTFIGQGFTTNLSWHNSAYFSFVATAVAAATVDARIDFSTTYSGASGVRMSLGSGMFMAGVGDPGAGKFNAVGVLRNGVEIYPTELGTAQATTSGTAFDWTGIPSWAKRVRINFNGVSVDGADQILVQIGDSGGIETTGYAAVSSYMATGPSFVMHNFTSAFPISTNSGTRVISGTMTLELANASTNLWTSSHVMADHGGNAVQLGGGGNKALSAVLDRVRVTRSGTGNFDAGSINIAWE